MERETGIPDPAVLLCGIKEFKDSKVKKEEVMKYVLGGVEL